jgi:H/ACA ribonucleoprotein complex subunit 4
LEELLPWEKRDKTFYRLKDDIGGEYGKTPEERSIPELLKYGFVNLDKPSGPTSHQVSALVKHFLELKKTGHGGTLDPKVTGVLPVALEKSTKVLQYLLTAGKEYVAVMHLHKPVDFEELKKIEKVFVGDIIQVPPVRSAVKRRPRKRKIYYLKILEYDEEKKNVLFKVGTEAGTYIRTLCVQIGNYLGVGAHMIALRRTKAGSFNEKSSVNLVELKDAYYLWKHCGYEKELRRVVLPVEKAVEHLPKVYIDDIAASAVLYGAKVLLPGIVKTQKFEKGENVAIFTMKDELIAIGKALVSFEELLKLKETTGKGEIIKVNTVLKDRDYFPPLWKKFKKSNT